MTIHKLPPSHSGKKTPGKPTGLSSFGEQTLYDAENLIKMAQKMLGREKISVRDALDLANRKYDDIGELKNAISIILKTRNGAMALTDDKKENLPSPENPESIISILEDRFYKNMKRHRGIDWDKIEERLKANPEKLKSLMKMEKTGGEPDCGGYDKETDEYIFKDYSKESPEGRRNLCYDRAGQKKAEAKGRKPAGNAVDMAAGMGIRILSEKEYNELEKEGDFDADSISYLLRPDDIESSGKVSFGTLELGNVEVCTDDEEDYYDENTGFRGILRV